MNDLYFACSDCKIYTDAGYRWAFAQLLESGIVSRRREVSVEIVLKAEDFWHPPSDENSRWLYQDIFPALKEFFTEHKTHRVIFGELEEIAPEEDYYADWTQVGQCNEPSLRHFVQIKGLKTWRDLQHYMIEQGQLAPIWWSCFPEAEIKKRFNEIVQEQPKS